MRGDELGPLHGVPVSVKDNVPVAGKPLTYGSRLLRENIARRRPRSRRASSRPVAIIVGRTNTPEFAWRGSTDNRLFGETRNPWDLGRTAGGSSGGAGAAVAAGLAPLAIGTDGAGSIRIPASFCGIVGHKPSFGRVPFYPSPGANELAAHRRADDPHGSRCGAVPGRAGRPDERDRFSLPATTRALRRVGRRWRPGLAGRLEPGPRATSRSIRRCARIAEAAARALRGSRREVDEPDLGLPDPEPMLAVLYPFVQAAAHAAAPARGARRDGPRPGRDCAGTGRSSRRSRSGARWRPARRTGTRCGAPSSRSTCWSRRRSRCRRSSLASSGRQVDGRRSCTSPGRWPTRSTSPAHRPSPCRAASPASGLPVGLQIVGTPIRRRRRAAGGGRVRGCPALGRPPPAL